MRCYRDWQFFNRKPEGSERLMQAIYTGLCYEIGFGLDPGRIWLSKLGGDGKYSLHFHCYLPFNNADIGFCITIGYRKKDGSWKNWRWPNG